MGRFVIICDIEDWFSSQMNRAFPGDAFEKGLKAGVKLEAKILEEKGISKDMAETIEKHLNYWIEQKEKGALKGGGPFMGFSKAMLIIDTESKEEAEKLVKGDPYTVKGVFKNYTIYQWFQAL